MEDNGRELDSDPVNTPPVKNGYQSSKELTIMLIGSVGKMRSLKISRKLILSAAFFFFLYIIISILIFYLYFSLYTAHKNQSNELQNLKAELNEKTKILEKKELYVKGLEEFYYTARKKMQEKTDEDITQKKGTESKNPKDTAPNEKKTKKTAKKTAAEKTDTEQTRKETTEPKIRAVNTSDEVKSQDSAENKINEKADTGATPEKIPEAKSPEVDAHDEVKSQDYTANEIKEKADTGATLENVPEPSAPEAFVSGETEKTAMDLTEGGQVYMEIRDLRFQRTDSRLTLDFRLTNLLADEESAEGYIHIIVMNKEKACPPEWNSSYNKLADGFPVDFKHGQQFIIQRFRPYQRQYEKNPDSELPSYIRILVYDRSGQKILEKEFTITDETDNAPS